MEQEGTDKKQDDTEDIQTGDVIAAIKEIKETDPNNDNKSLNVEDIEVDYEQIVSKAQYASDDFIREIIKGDIVEVEVSNQSSIILSSIIGSKQILEGDEEANDSMNAEVEREVLISDEKRHSMIEELNRESSGGSYYGAGASWEIDG